MIRVIGFDADDTLWITQPYYDEAKKLIIECIGKENDDLYRSKFAANMNHIGTGVGNTLLSFYETLTEMKIASDENAVDAFRKVKDILTNKPSKVEKSTVDVLNNLSENFDILLLTRGNMVEQTNAINASGIKHLFRSYQIMIHKNKEEYEEKVFRHYDINPEEFLMVGNTLKTDIHPVLECGGYGIYIPGGHWHGDYTDKEDHTGHERFFTVNSITEVPKIIVQINAACPTNNTCNNGIKTSLKPRAEWQPK